MLETLKRLIGPEYLVVAEPGPLGARWMLYLLLGLLFAAGLGVALWVLAGPRRRRRPSGRKAWAWFALWVCLAGVGTVAGRFLGWPGWSARIWPYSLAGLALAGGVAYASRHVEPPAWLARQLRILALGPLPAAQRAPGRRSGLIPALGLLLHLAGTGLVAGARYGWPLWTAPLLLLALLLPQIPLLARRSKGHGLELGALTPLLAAYGATLLWLAYRWLGISVRGWQGLAFPDPMTSLFYVDGIVLAAVAYTLLCQLHVTLQALESGRLPPGLLWRGAATGMLVATLGWAATVYLGKRTHGATASDPYAYAQMGVDLAERGTFAHRFSLFEEVIPLQIPWAPLQPVGYHIPRNDLGDCPSVWATGASAALAAGYALLGEVGLYVTTPFLALLSLAATWALVHEVLRREPHGVRTLTAALAVALLATSPEHVDRLLVPMADAAAQLFTVLTLLFLLRGARHLASQRPSSLQVHPSWTQPLVTEETSLRGARLWRRSNPRRHPRWRLLRRSQKACSLLAMTSFLGASALREQSAATGTRSGNSHLGPPRGLRRYASSRLRTALAPGDDKALGGSGATGASPSSTHGDRVIAAVYWLLAGICFAWAYWARHTQLVLALSAPIGIWVLGLRRPTATGSSPGETPAPHNSRPWLRALLALALFGGAALLGALPDIVYRWRWFGGLLATETTELPLMGLKHIGPVAWEMLRAVLAAGEWGYLFPLALYGAYRLVRARHVRPQALVVGSAFLAVLLVHLTYGSLRLRDLLSLFPLLDLAVAYGAVSLLRQARALAREATGARRPLRLGRALLPAGAAAWIVLSLALSRWAMIDNLWKPGWASFGYMRAEQRAAFDQLAALTPPEAIVGASLNAGAVALYAGRDPVRPYDSWTTEEWHVFLQAMDRLGRPVYLLDDGGLMASFIEAQRGQCTLEPVAELWVPLFYTRDRDTGWLYRLSGCTETAEAHPADLLQEVD
jgi:hypothetical protein